MILAAVFATAPYRDSGSREPSGTADTAATRQKPKESFWQRTTDDPVATFTGVLAFFTLALVCVSIVQIYFLTKADKTASASANAAMKAADVARDAVQHSDRNASIQLRAYVFLEGFQSTRLVNKTNIDADPVVWAYGFQALWRNVGNTPSLKTDAMIAVKIIDSLEHEVIPVFQYKYQEDAIGINIGSKIPIKTGPINIDIEVITDVMQRRKRIFLFTKIRYVDLFDEQTKRTDEFAVEVQIISSNIYDPAIISDVFRFSSVERYVTEEE